MHECYYHHRYARSVCKIVHKRFQQQAHTDTHNHTKTDTALGGGQSEVFNFFLYVSLFVRQLTRNVCLADGTEALHFGDYSKCVFGRFVELVFFAVNKNKREKKMVEKFFVYIFF